MVRQLRLIGEVAEKALMMNTCMTFLSQSPTSPYPVPSIAPYLYCRAQNHFIVNRGVQIFPFERKR